MKRKNLFQTHPSENISFQKTISGLEKYANIKTVFNDDFELILNHLSESQKKYILIASEFFLINWINEHVKPVSLKLSNQNGNIYGDWQAPSLLSTIYFELYLKYSQHEIIRKCSNPTCPDYFEISGKDTRKIYCSTRCAQLEAKRKQRQREKEKSKKDGNPNG